jgi:sugar phosphate isomerase/epimerase
MKKAICHYSFHRRYAAEKWTPDRLAQEVAALGVEGIDYHARLLGSTEGTAALVKAAVVKHGLTLSGMSFSTNFNRAKKEELKSEVEATKKWVQFAAGLKAPVSRIFGGHITDDERKDPAARAAAWQRMIDGVAAVTKEAEKFGLVLALENHGGLPCTAQEQIDAIKAINSPSLRATIDFGNYMSGGEEGHVATAKVAPYCAYVHVKDYKKVADKATPWGWSPLACAVGEGDVKLTACMEALKKSGYTGFVALEYEGPEDETTGVPKSVATLKKLVV